jgi:hypothetical protein
MMEGIQEFCNRYPNPELDKLQRLPVVTFDFDGTSSKLNIRYSITQPVEEIGIEAVRIFLQAKVRLTANTDHQDPPCRDPHILLIRALEDGGQYEKFPQLLDRWQEMIDGGFSTWAEDITYWRSLCHAWSAFPTIEFLRGVLGIKPGKPGFEEILIQPPPLNLQFAEGSVPTPFGKISIRLRQTASARQDDRGVENGTFSIEVTATAGIPLKIILPDGSTHPAESSFTGRCSYP